MAFHWYQLIRPLLFCLPPETAHRVLFGTLDPLESVSLLSPFVPAIEPLPRTIMGLTFPNPVGLAAGLDKDAAHLDVLSALGFGFIEVGTVTPYPQSGNPKPRLFRLPATQGLINRMGFNNQGVENLIKNIWRSRFTGVLGINIGKNALTPMEKAHEDYADALESVYPYASYIAINISSPNTKNLRELQSGDQLDLLLSTLKQTRERLLNEHNAYRPMALKIAPDLDDDAIAAIAQRVAYYGLDGVIATNTTLDKSKVQHLRHGMESGGLSGAPLRASSDAVIRRLRAHLDPKIPIIGVGGITQGSHAVSKIEAGASLVQFYTGLIYRGPSLIRECVEALRNHQSSQHPKRQRPSAQGVVEYLTDKTQPQATRPPTTSDIEATESLTPLNPSASSPAPLPPPPPV